MPRSDEKKTFHLRLKQALKRAPRKANTPTELALEFNLRHKGDSISPQAAQKWLSGETMPTIDKIETLADWLNVSVQWLRLGIPGERSVTTDERGTSPRKTTSAVRPTEDELKLLGRLRGLSEHRRHLVIEVLEQFALDQEMWHD